tara:strand:- start:594 stop:1019 length:426 start_codon:yes stop_codon:yes gene_type:complete
MKNSFKQLSIRPGFMKHNGGILFRELSRKKYEFKTKIKRNHLNLAGITHGGFIASIIDAGAGTGAHRASGNQSCVTISLDINFISATKLGDEVLGIVKIQKKTSSMIFLNCHLECKRKIVATASGIWKILNKPIKKAGYGG